MTRISAVALSILMVVLAGGCTRENNERVGAEARKAEQQSKKAAKELGKVAYKAAEETGKAAKKAGAQLKQATHDAHEGWEEEKQKERAKQGR